jgi:peroxiredoxin
MSTNFTPKPDPAHDPNLLPAGLPVPPDDGAARHLAGTRLPAIALPATDGGEVDLARLAGRTVVYIYPRTGRPGVALPDGWDAIPGARGCTPQSCSFRDHFAELKSLGVAHLFGLSTQDTGYQREAVDRLHLPFAILSDAGLRLTGALALPTLRGCRHDAPQAHDAGHRRRCRRQGLLSGVSAR